MPPTSYGLVCTNDSRCVLLIQRKDSVNFVAFVSGNADADLTRCTRGELERLARATDFVSDLWTPVRGTNGFATAKERFDAMRTSGQLHARIQIAMPLAYDEPEWEFPKGRKKHDRESPVACAVREFCEETGYAAEDVAVNPERTFDDTCVGGDGRLYRHVYFCARVKDGTRPSRRASVHEVQTMRWFHVNDLLSSKSPFRPYDSLRRRVVAALDKNPP